MDFVVFVKLVVGLLSLLFAYRVICVDYFGVFCLFGLFIGFAFVLNFSVVIVFETVALMCWLCVI